MQLPSCRTLTLLGAVLMSALTPALAGVCSPVCNSLYTPDFCLGTISGVFTISGVSTSGRDEQDTFDCGSKDTTMRDVIFQFQAGVTGMYTIKTENIGSFDTTLQVERCDASVIACNDDVSGTDKSSLVQVSLSAGTNYIVAVSKSQPSDAEPTFTLRISLNSATSAPVTTKAPTVSTLAPSTRSPTFATVAPSLPATKSPTSTFSPTEVTVTISPTSENKTATTTDQGGEGVIIGVASGAGLLAAFALAFVGKRTYERRSASQSSIRDWTPEEDAKLRNAYHATHDLQALYPQFPDHSRESVALRVRDVVLGTETKFPFISAPRMAKSTYLFVAERRRVLTNAISSRFHQSPAGGANSSRSGFIRPREPIFRGGPPANNIIAFDHRAHTVSSFSSSRNPSFNGY